MHSKRNADEVSLVVDGKCYSGWKSVRITRSIECLAGSFALDATDRWDGAEPPRPIAAEDPCLVLIGKQPVIAGYVDKRSVSASAESRTQSYSGRDAAAALVDCSAVLDAWSFEKVNVGYFVAMLAEPFGVQVSLQPGLVLPEIKKLSVAPGDTAFNAIMHAVADQGVLLISDGAGGIVITRSGTSRAASLVEGQNILSASAEYDGAGRFHRYVVPACYGDDDGFYTARSEAVDEIVRRTERTLFAHSDLGHDIESATRRAEWEARIRAARAESVTVTVQGWTQPDGRLWPINALTHVEAPRLIGVDGDLLISEVEHSISEQGKITQFRLVRPDVFTPAPKSAGIKKLVRLKKGATAGYPELRNGALPEPVARMKRLRDAAHVFAVVIAPDEVRAVTTVVKKLIP